MTPDEIRALYVETLARAELASMSFIANDGVRSIAMRTNEDAAQAAVDALAEVGMLPDRQEETVSEHNEIGRRFVTAWKKVGELVDGAARYASEVSE